MIGYDGIFDHIESLKSVYDFDDKEYVGNMCSPIATWHGKVRREDYTQPNQLPCEGRMYLVPRIYEAYLEPLYGKNCTTELPLPEKRKVNHAEKVYRYVE